jgi:hypothetical protein
MKITFAHDKKAGKPHYLVRHPDLDTHECEEVFSKPIVVIGQRGTVLKAVGRTLGGRFLTVVFIRRRGNQCHVITAWPSKRKQILLWHREMKKK